MAIGLIEELSVGGLFVRDFGIIGSWSDVGCGFRIGALLGALGGRSVGIFRLASVFALGLRWAAIGGGISGVDGCVFGSYVTLVGGRLEDGGFTLGATLLLGGIGRCLLVIGVAFAVAFDTLSLRFGYTLLRNGLGGESLLVVSIGLSVAIGWFGLDIRGTLLWRGFGCLVWRSIVA